MAAFEGEGVELTSVEVKTQFFVEIFHVTGCIYTLVFVFDALAAVVSAAPRAIALSGAFVSGGGGANSLSFAAGVVAVFSTGDLELAAEAKAGLSGRGGGGEENDEVAMIFILVGSSFGSMMIIWSHL